MTTKKKYGTELLKDMFGRPSFGELLEARRLGENLSQKEMAKILEITPSSLCDLEKGRRLPSLARAAKIAKKLELNEVVYIEAVIQDQLDKINSNLEVSLKEKVS